MTDLNIIVFLCNWGPHAAFQVLQDNASQIPAEVDMVRIPCSGRISKALLLKPFEMGADGVLLIGCKSGTCHYGTGTLTALKNVEDTRDILGLLGLRKDRLRLATFLPDESDELLGFLTDFYDDIKEVGKSPVVPAPKEEMPVEASDPVSQIVAAHDVYACQDCGKCSSACPLALSGKPFSSWAMVNAIIMGRIDSPAVQNDIWSCLTCGICYERCPSAVNLPEFVRDIRHFLTKKGESKGESNRYEAHGGFFLSLMRTMTSKALKFKRWDWLPDDIQTDPESRVLFFGGCAPYFDIFFRNHLGIQTSDIIIDSLKLLNFFDIHPALLNEERCCGHDLIWSGDKENFLRLAKLNVEAIHDMGIEEVVTTCPECYWTLAHDYPGHGIEMNFKVTHIYDLLEREIDKGAVGFKEFNHKLTFQDPCRLSRFEHRSELPRKLINRLKPKVFKEMQDSGTGAICCGNCAWIGCDSFSKALQVKRIRQAHDTGSDILVTACPKCQIHLSCGMEDPFLGKELKMEMMDLVSIMAKTIQWE